MQMEAHPCRYVRVETLPFAFAELVEEPADVPRIVLLVYRDPFRRVVRSQFV
jgi:hypothetical protein